MIRFFFVMAMTVVILLFGLANLQVVELKTLFTESIRASLAFLLLGAFGAGFVTAMLAGIHRSFTTARKRKSVRAARGPSDIPLPLPPPPRLPARNQQTPWKPQLQLRR